MKKTNAPEPRFSSNRSAAIRELIVSVAESGTPQNLHQRNARRGWIVLPAAFGALVLTAGAVVALQAQVTQTDHVSCFARAEIGVGGKFPGTQVTDLQGTVGESVGGPIPIEDALAACSDLWSQHLLDASIPSGVNPERVDRTFSHPVPEPLTVCVMSDGMAAVIPGPPEVCGRLGLAEKLP